MKRPVRLGYLAAALLVCLAAPAFFVAEIAWLGWVLLATGLVGAWIAERYEAGRAGANAPAIHQPEMMPRPASLLRDLSLIAIGLAIVRSIPLAAELDNLAFVRFTLALGGAVLVPYLISRYVYRDRATGFPWRGRLAASQSDVVARGAAHGGSPRSEARGGGRLAASQSDVVARGAAHGGSPRSEARGGGRLAASQSDVVARGAAHGGSPRSEARGGGGGQWGLLHWGWLVAVLVLGWLILPFYFIGSGVYQNWPVVDSPELIARLFVGVGAVGIWDELFFICTVFALLRRHFPDWLANGLQAIVFVSFLWELGYRAWGPALTIPFALIQGWIFVRTRSLSYVVTVHLLFDAVVFAVLVHAHNPDLFAIFPTAP
ncbi:CPBP family intramembrane glutamic endopeptidase [Leucobacter sp. Z1108]|uniref:CPBP family intramembrane glutamic endopeptidase n=1 Tax=Leucobacter sp. Z1108 TaxID=3439066 RepID=UPI00403E0698